MWDAIGHISTGLTLAAFLAAAGLSAYRSHLKTRANVLLGLPPEARANELARELNSFGIEAKGLTREQQFRLALEEFELRRARLRSITAVVMVLAIISGLIAAFSIWSVPGKTRDAVALTPGRLLWTKNLDAIRSTNSGLGSSNPNSCGYRFFVHRETFVSALTALELSTAPELSGLRDQLLASINNMANNCGNDEWYNLPLSPAMQGLHSKLRMELRARAIEAGVQVLD